MSDRKCPKCGEKVTYDEARGCYECLICYPKNRVIPVQEEEKKVYIDVKPNEERVDAMINDALNMHIKTDGERIREIVRDELENWHIQKPPMTVTEVDDATGDVIGEVEVNWRQQAKSLGIPLGKVGGVGARKKEDVMADIAAKLNPIPAGTPCSELSEVINTVVNERINPSMEATGTYD